MLASWACWVHVSRTSKSRERRAGAERLDVGACAVGCVYLFRLVVIHDSEGATRGLSRVVDHPWQREKERVNKEKMEGETGSWCAGYMSAVPH